jgi:hypothetical protein
MPSQSQIDHDKYKRCMPNYGKVFKKEEQNIRALKQKHKNTSFRFAKAERDNNQFDKMEPAIFYSKSIYPCLLHGLLVICHLSFLFSYVSLTSFE